LANGPRKPLPKVRDWMNDYSRIISEIVIGLFAVRMRASR
jgi:hypothetical protein